MEVLDKGEMYVAVQSTKWSSENQSFNFVEIKILRYTYCKILKTQQATVDGIASIAGFRLCVFREQSASDPIWACLWNGKGR